MVIRGSRKLLIKQLDTSLIQENFVGARRRDAHQIGPRVMVFDADRVFGHAIYKALDHGVCRLTPSASAFVSQQPRDTYHRQIGRTYGPRRRRVRPMATFSAHTAL